MKISTRIASSLTLVQKQAFSNQMIFNSSANPIKERVVSTPTWPVPYYQRIHKAYPVRGTLHLIQKRKTSVSIWWISKSMTPTGSQPKEFSIRHSREDKSCSIPKITSKPTVNFLLIVAYLIRKDDCESMVRAYVDDAGQFLDLANRENVRILAGKTLIWFTIVGGII